MVRPDGTFMIRATLRSFFTDDGDLTLAARGRYAVASVEGGNATVYGIAGQDTHVVLSQPQLRAAAQDRRQAPALLGADPRRRQPRARRHQARQQDARDRLLHEAGTFSKTILKPAERGNLRVVASVPGADTAISNATPLSR